MFRKLLRERARARTVATLTSAGTAAEPGFDRLVEQAATAFAAPMALVTMLQDDQLIVQASKGLEVQCAARRDSFCNHGIDRDVAILEVCDALADPVFMSLPSVTGDPHARYYIGSPLVLSSGLEVGMLCVLDTKARPPASRDQRAYLVGLARQASAVIERNAQLKGAMAA